VVALLELLRGNSFLMRRDLARAEVSYRNALRIQEATLPADHPDLARSLENLGTLLHRRGEHEPALELHRRALALRERALDPGDPAIATTLQAMCATKIALRKAAEAVVDCTRALAIYEKAGAAGKDRAYVETSLGDAELALGQGERAVAHYERALALREGVPDEVERAAAQFGLARALWTIGRERARASELANTAEQAFEKAGATVERDAVREWLAGK
jgi:tetratricopeptide (TPR) repeat protein